MELRSNFREFEKGKIRK